MLRGETAKAGELVSIWLSNTEATEVKILHQSEDPQCLLTVHCECVCCVQNQTLRHLSWLLQALLSVQSLEGEEEGLPRHSLHSMGPAKYKS